MKHLSARRSTPASVRAERFFPVRLRIVVPPFGFGMKLAEMDYWLKHRAGARNYYAGGSSGFGEIGRPYEQYTTYHFLDVATAQAFMDHFRDAASLALGSESDRPV